MKIKLYADIKFNLPITQEQIDALMICSRNHYDGTCKMASREASMSMNSKNGFLVMWSNGLEYSSSKTVDATWREIDLALKIMEGRNMEYNCKQITETQKILLDKLSQVFRRCLSLGNQYYTKWPVEEDISEITI